MYAVTLDGGLGHSSERRGSAIRLVLDSALPATFDTVLDFDKDTQDPESPRQFPGVPQQGSPAS